MREGKRREDPSSMREFAKLRELFLFFGPRIISLPDIANALFIQIRVACHDSHLHLEVLATSDSSHISISTCRVHILQLLQAKSRYSIEILYFDYFYAHILKQSFRCLLKSCLQTLRWCVFE